MPIRLRKAVSIILVMLMVISGWNGMFIGGGKAYAAVSFAGGTGTAGNPYQIATADQLNEVRYLMEAGLYFELAADIDLNGYAAGEGWMPIGDSNNTFKGNLDSKGYKITDLTINRPSANNVGLFGFLDSGSELNHIILENVNVVGYQNVGALAGFNQGIINKSYTTGEITSTYQAGGLTGYNQGTINNSYSTGNVNANQSFGGGLIGYNNGPVNSSYATGTVNADMNAGGLIGGNQGYVSNSFARGSVTGSGNVGGLAGANYFTPITNSYAAGAVSGTTDVGGLIGYYYSGGVNNSFYDSVTTGRSDTGNGSGLTTLEMLTQSTYSGWDFSNVWAIDSSRNDGYPLLRDFYHFVTYDGNGNTEGAVPADSNAYASDDTASVAHNTGSLVKTGYTFMGWNTLADGSGTSYDPADTFPITENRMLYAKWLSSAATLTSTIGAVSTGGTATETITAIPYGTTLAALKAAITQATDATYEVYDADGTTVATALATGMKIIVTAQDGTTQVTYTVTVIAATTGATLTSTIGTVSTGGTATETITDIPYGTTLSELEDAITLAANATYEVYDADGITQATTLATGNKIIVTAQDGTTQVTYTVTVIAATTGATLTSTIGTVSTGGISTETITAIPYGTTLSELEDAITVAANATYEIYDADGITEATALATGMKIIVTAQDGTTQVTYTVTVNEIRAIATAAIAGVTAPEAFATPVSSISSTDEYTATISWTPSVVKFAPGVAYTATITLTPKIGYTLTGVATDFFTVTGASNTTNTADTGIVTAIFPATAAIFDSGTGSMNDPYLISTAAQLNKVRDVLDASFKLTADIDLISYAGGEGWEPIGTWDHYFRGNFNGNGFKIKNLTINRPTTDEPIGLFGYIYNTDSLLTNIILEDVNIIGNEYMGGLVGMIENGTISTSYVTGSVTGNGYIGGLVGYNYRATISTSYVTGSVTGNEYIGGLVGYNYRATVSTSYVTGSVTGNEYIGGLVGYNYISAGNGSINNSFYDITTTGQSDTGKGLGILTTAEMQTQGTYTDWDFDSVWYMLSGQYPRLWAFTALTPGTNNGTTKLNNVAAGMEYSRDGSHYIPITGTSVDNISASVGNTITVRLTAAISSLKVLTVNTTNLNPAIIVTPPVGGGDGSPQQPTTIPSDTPVISTNGQLTLPVGRSGEVGLGDEVKVSVPKDASSKELKITIEKVVDPQHLTKNNEILISPVFEILKNFSENFNKSVTLTFTFNPASLKSNQKAAVFYYDETEKRWVLVGGGKLNGNQISVEVDHFTKFAVFAVDQEAVGPVVPTIHFSDILGHWAETDIKQAVANGIVKGYLDGTFKPNQTVTRAEFTVMLMNALKPLGEGAELTFTDTSKIGAWAQNAVAQAVQAGLINGYEDGSFRPNAEITRAEMAVMIAKALGLSTEAKATTGFADDKDIPAWAKGAVAKLRKLELIAGVGANQFKAHGKATRAEAVTVMLRMLEQMSN